MGGDTHRLKMTFRVNQKDLEAALERLNTVSKRTYRIDYAYGKCRLNVMEKGTSINNVSSMCSKPELYYTMHTILNYIEKENKETV